MTPDASIVLVVEPDGDVRERLTNLLPRVGAIGIPAANVEIAVVLLRRLAIDLIVFGAEAATADAVARLRHVKGHVAVVVVAGGEHEIASRSLAVDEVLVEPLNLDKLGETVRRLRARPPSPP